MTKYQSSGGSKVSAAQYLAEILMIRKAASQKRKLPHKFWNISPLDLEYRRTLVFVRKLINAYEYPEAVVKAYCRPEFKHVYTTGTYRGLDKAIMEEENSIRGLLKSVDNIPEMPEKSESKPIKQFGNKSKLSKLRELE